jgi:hypothetical protein
MRFFPEAGVQSGFDDSFGRMQRDYKPNETTWLAMMKNLLALGPYSNACKDQQLALMMVAIARRSI